MGNEVGHARARRNARDAMRLHEPPLNPASLSRAAGVDVKTVRAFLTGDRWPHPDTLVKLDRGLGLADGSIERWSEGEDVDTRPAPVRSPTLDEATDLELARALLARIEARGAGQP